MTKDFSKHELVSILETVEAARNCSDEISLRQLIKQVKELVCADNCICGLANMDAKGLTDVVTVVNGDYPEQWLNLYLAGELYKKDPVVKFHAQFGLTQLWKDTFELYDEEASKQVLMCAGDFGLNHGITGGIFDPDMKNLSIFSFSGDADRFNAHHKNIVDVVTLHLHRALARTYRISRLITSPVSLSETIN
jgi:hypothetical protein